MSLIEVTFDLPFYLRVENAFVVLYEKVCREAQVPELVGRTLEITFSNRDAGKINRMSRPKVQYDRTTVSIKVETSSNLLEDSVGRFAIQNCLEILNRVIVSYQATTGEVANAGFIQPLGTSDIQLFAEIRVNGKDFRDRWPGHSLNTFPLSADQSSEFQRYLVGQQDLPLDRLFLTNAALSLEQGQYPMAVLQAATAVELKVTQVVSQKLKAAGWSDQAIAPYERMTLGQKLQIPQSDPRSLGTYFNTVSEFPTTYKQVKDDLTPLRNRVAHRGHMASQEEAKQAVSMVRKFLSTLS